jgi:hypothetical protein
VRGDVARKGQDMVGSALQHFHPASQSCTLADSLLNECKAMFWFAHAL